jgi:hypothetical protein
MDLFEQFYSLAYSWTPRGIEWTKDKEKKHRAFVRISQTEMNKYQVHYVKKQPVAKDLLSFLLFGVGNK